MHYFHNETIRRGGGGGVGGGGGEGSGWAEVSIIMMLSVPKSVWRSALIDF